MLSVVAGEGSWGEAGGAPWHSTFASAGASPAGGGSGDPRRKDYQESWFRGSWFDALEIYWRDLTTPGPFKNRRYREVRRNDHGLLAAHLRLKPGQTRNVRFVIGWNFPFCENYWSKDALQLAEKAGVPARWRNHYATLWKDSLASASMRRRSN